MKINKEILLSLVSLFFVVTPLLAQHDNDVPNSSWNLRDFDKRKYHFGFLLGFNNMSFNQDSDISEYDTLMNLEVKPQVGIHLGIIADYHVTTNLSLRVTPTLSFGQRTLQYTFLDEGFIRIEDRIVESTTIEFPLDLKFRANRHGNFAPYLIGGGRVILDLSNQSNFENTVPIQEQMVRIEKLTYNWEIGIGADFFLEYFKFSPEIKFVMSMDNALIQDGSFWTAPINQLYPKAVMISFNFEG